MNDEPNILPPGLWYEEPKRRWRVRRYHNRRVYLKGYYRTYQEAIVALDELNEELAKIPKVRRNRRNNKGE